MTLLNPIFNPNDFIDSGLVDGGVVVSRTPVTKVELSNGNESLVDGTPENITVVIKPDINKYVQEKLGLHKNTAAIMHTDPSQSIEKEDKITYKSVIYRVVNVRLRDVPTDGTLLYKFCELQLVG